MRPSKMEWTESTWNPVTGCTKISAGCKNCYAERMAARLLAMGQPNYRNGFQVTCHEHALHLPLEWRKPQTIFVNSMSDLFHEDIPDEFIARVFEVMARADWHRFQVLTKRAERLRELAPSLPWPDHIWMGVSVENKACTTRISALRGTPAKIKFLSMEPLIGPVKHMNLSGIDWVIVGGESGPGARSFRASKPSTSGSGLGVGWNCERRVGLSLLRVPKSDTPQGTWSEQSRNGMEIPIFSLRPLCPLRLKGTSWFSSSVFIGGPDSFPWNSGPWFQACARTSG